jgi:hypothetical protein
MPSDFTYRRLFGSYRAAVIEAGFIPKKTGGFSPQARIASAEAHRGKRSFRWKGGRIKDKWGYVQIWMPEHPNAKGGGYVHEHRLVMSNHIGRPLLRTENVHHKNGERDDNRLVNLELWDTTQPSGQRVEDKIKWAIEFLKKHNYETNKI